MITVVHHEDDLVIVEAARVLRDLSAAGLLADLVLVAVGNATRSAQPQATCIRAGAPTEVGLFDALARDPATGGHVMTAVASAALAPQAQIELAEEVVRLSERGMNLGSVPVVASCLYVPESRDGDGILPAAGFFSARTTNFVALPTDWRFVDGMAVAIDFSDTGRTAWHAALEIATLTCSWGVVADSRWQPEILAPGISGYGLRFVRSSARLVAASRSGPAGAGDTVLPTPDGFTPAPVPELVGQTVAFLHPEAFRLDGQLDGLGGVRRRAGVLRPLIGALGGLFPPLASGLRGFWRLLRSEVVKTLGGDSRLRESDQPLAAQPDRNASEATVVLEGFEPQVWTDLVRNVLGVADGGGTDDAGEARRAAGHKQFVFVTRDSLLDDVLEQRLNDADPDDVQDAGLSGGATGSSSAVGDVEETPAPSSDRGLRRGLLTLIDDAFCREIARARARRQAQQQELDRLNEQAERAEQVEPSPTLRGTVIAFGITAFVAVASYVLLLETFDFGDLDKALRARLAIVATALTWLALLYPLAPRGDDDPRATHSYLMRSAALVAVVAALAAVFAAPIAGFSSSGGPWLELVPLVPAAVTLRLAWKVRCSESALHRPAGRAVALAWTTCYLIAGLLLYANLGSYAADAGDEVDRSVFNRWGTLGRFFEEYGDSLRYAAVAVAGFLLLLALAMLAVGHAGSDRLHRRARARMRELHTELQREELVPMLKGLRVNWLGTAFALDHILRLAFPPLPAPTGTSGDLHSPLLRLATRSCEGYGSRPAPGWLFAQYEMAADAYSARRDTRTDGTQWARPETATMVSRLGRNPLAVPGSDPRWDFAHRLYAGEFDEVLAAGLPGADDGSLLDSDLEFMGEIAPVAPTALPLGPVGPGAARLGHIDMHVTWWWPDGFGVPEALNPPRPARATRSTHGHAYLAVRLDVSDPVLERQLSEGSAPPAASDDESPTVGPDHGLR